MNEYMNACRTFGYAFYGIIGLTVTVAILYVTLLVVNKRKLNNK